MAQNDVFTYTMVANCDGVEVSNVGYAQIVDEVNAANAMQELATYVQNNVLDDMAKFTADSMQWTSIVVRRLKPAVTDVLVQDVSQSGDLPTAMLPSTVCAIANYYCLPYERGQSNHWKLTGLPKDSNNRGVLTDEGVLRYADFISRMTGSPYVMGQNSFSFCRPLKSDDLAGQALPVIYKMSIGGCLRNLRSRQLY